MASFRRFLQNTFGVRLLTLSQADRVDQPVIRRPSQFSGNVFNLEKRIDSGREDETKWSRRRHFGDALGQFYRQGFDVPRAQLLFDEQTESM